MPRISDFYGIVIAMYWNDHAPPHFHAIYGEYETRVVIETGEFLDEGFPTRARRLVEEWVALHTEELLTNWGKAREGTPLDKIDPLP